MTTSNLVAQVNSDSRTPDSSVTNSQQTREDGETIYVKMEPEPHSGTRTRTVKLKRKSGMASDHYNQEIIASQTKYAPIQVSPRNPFPPRKPPPANLPPLPFPPAKRYKSNRGNFQPKIQDLSKNEVESLLPGSVFGQGQHIMRHGYWSVADERKLRRSWNWLDEEVLSSQGTSTFEIGVWAVLAELYRCTPRDLFRYGLRWAPPPPAGYGRSHATGYDANERFYRALLRLLPHPFFRGDIAVLRTALQVAVMTRVGEKRHVPPVGPGWSRASPAFVRWLDETPLDRRDENWRRDRACVAEMRWTTQVLRLICREAAMDETPQGQSSLHDWLRRYYQDLHTARGGLSSAPKTPWKEGIMFMLQIADLEALEFALDKLYLDGPEGDGCNGGRYPAAWYFERYWKGAQWGGRGEHEHVGPLDRAEVKAQKRLFALAERREALIRIRLHQAGDAHRLLDLPPFDPDTDFERWEVCRRGHKHDPGPLIALECASVLLASTLEWLMRRADPEARALLEFNLEAIKRSADTRQPTRRTGAVMADSDYADPEGGPRTSSTIYSAPGRWQSYLCGGIISPRTNLRWAGQIVRSRISGHNPYSKYTQVNGLVLTQRIGLLEPWLDDLGSKLHDAGVLTDRRPPLAPGLQSDATGREEVPPPAEVDAGRAWFVTLMRESIPGLAPPVWDPPVSSTEDGGRLPMNGPPPRVLGVETPTALYVPQPRPPQELLPQNAPLPAPPAPPAPPVPPAPPLQQRRQPSVAPLHVSV